MVGSSDHPTHSWIVLSHLTSLTTCKKQELLRLLLQKLREYQEVGNQQLSHLLSISSSDWQKLFNHCTDWLSIMAHQHARILQVLAVLLPAFLVQCYKIDPETEARTIIRRRDQAELQLVMSDEFSLDGRSFAKGDDDVFEAQHRPDDINQAISFCK